MAEQEGCGGWLMGRKVAPIEASLDGAIHDVNAEVRLKHIGVHEGQCQACRYAAKEDWAQGRIVSL